MVNAAPEKKDKSDEITAEKVGTEKIYVRRSSGLVRNVRLPASVSFKPREHGSDGSGYSTYSMLFTPRPEETFLSPSFWALE